MSLDVLHIFFLSFSLFIMQVKACIYIYSACISEQNRSQNFFKENKMHVYVSWMLLGTHRLNF
jgi:hypothetical protein